MSGIFKYPVENTIAFGGVPTGNTNANEAAIAVGIIKYRGCMDSRMACKKITMVT